MLAITGHPAVTQQMHNQAQGQESRYGFSKFGHFLSSVLNASLHFDPLRDQRGCARPIGLATHDHKKPEFPFGPLLFELMVKPVTA
jgi:hypothetical protein